MAYYLHGTPTHLVPELLSTLKAGQPLDKKSIWSCSRDDDYLYLWDINAVLRNEGYLDHSFTEEEQAVFLEEMSHNKQKILEYLTSDNYQPVSDAMWSGLLQSVQYPKSFTGVTTLLVEVPEDVVDLDDSCEGMDNARRVHFEDFSQVKVHAQWDAPLSAYYLPVIAASLLERELAELSDVDEDVIQFAKVLQKNDSTLSALWESVNEKLYCPQFSILGA